MGWRVTAAKFGFMTALILMAVGADRAAAYTPEQQEACSDDAMRLCGKFVPDVDQITACMIRSKAQLSQRCAVYFQPPPRAAFANKPPRQAKSQDKSQAKPQAKSQSKSQSKSRTTGSTGDTGSQSASR